MGGVISRISTVAIFTPQRCVTSSILACKSWLICSRLANTSSSGISPHNRPQRGRGNPLGGSRKILDLDHAGDRIALGQQIVELTLAEDAAEGGLAGRLGGTSCVNTDARGRRLGA